MAFYKANICFLPKFDALSPCRRQSDPSGLGKFYTITPASPGTVSIKPGVDISKLTTWTHPLWGVRNTVYHADRTYSTSASYAPEIDVPINSMPSGHQIGSIVRPQIDFAEVKDVITSYAGHDRHQDRLASFCRYHCARAMGCVAFKVDWSTSSGGCTLHGAGKLQPDVSGRVGMSFSMTRLYAPQTVATIESMITSLGISYTDLLTPVPYSYGNIQNFYYFERDTSNPNRRCASKTVGGTTTMHEVNGVTLEQCEHMRREVSTTRQPWNSADSATEQQKTAFSYYPGNANTPSLCVIPRLSSTGIHATDSKFTCDTTTVLTGSSVYHVKKAIISQLYSASINPWYFPPPISVKQCALLCLSHYMQGCRVFTHSPHKPDLSIGTKSSQENACYLFPDPADGQATGGASTPEATNFAGIKYDGGAKTYVSPSYRVVHPSMYMKTDVGIYEYARDMGTRDKCAGTSHAIGATIEVSAANALVECADRCARAARTGDRKVCNAFSIQAPNRCTLYTRCDDSTRAMSDLVTWNYRVRSGHGPFLYSGTPSQRCETEYSLDFADEASGPVHKGTGTNALQQCMDLCAAHNRKAGKDGKGCGGFSVADNGACALVGPCTVKLLGAASASACSLRNATASQTPKTVARSTHCMRSARRSKPHWLRQTLFARVAKTRARMRVRACPPPMRLSPTARPLTGRPPPSPGSVT